MTPPHFDILETLALQDGQLRHISDHLSRMAQAAAHFQRPWPAQQMAQLLQALCAQHPQGLWRVRVLLNPQGQPSVQAFAAEPSPAHVTLQLASRPLMEAHSEFTRFKTTHRTHYDAFTPTAPGVFDTLLYNAQDQITECTRGNVAFKIDGRWVTPSLECGLLNGVGRLQRVRNGEWSEAVVARQDLARAEAIAFINSLRGEIIADLLPEPAR